MVLKLLEKLNETHELNHDEIVYLLTHLDDASERTLFQYAHQTRLHYYGNRVYLRGLIEFSNICRQQCLYCGIRASNQSVERYRMLPQEILECCRHGYGLGYRTFVLQSGEDPWYTVDILCELIRDCKREFPDAAVTLSIGEREIPEYLLLRKAGADRFLMRHETADNTLYGKLHPGTSLERRIASLFALKEFGFQVGAGFMVGLPGQGPEELAKDLTFLRELHPDMIGIGPFIAHSQTPLHDCESGTLQQTLVMVALARLFVPDALLPATTALGTLHPQGREQALSVGANVLMPNLTPVGYRPKYQLYENKICIDDDSDQCRSCIEWRIELAGLKVDMGRGDSLNSSPLEASKLAATNAI